MPAVEVVDQALELGETIGARGSSLSCVEYVILEHAESQRAAALEGLHVAERLEAGDFVELGSEVEGQAASQSSVPTSSWECQ